MIKLRKTSLNVIAAVIGFSAASTVLLSGAYAQTAAETPEKADVLRAEISKPLFASQTLFDAKNYAEAIAKLAETDTVENKTPYEQFAIERTRGKYELAAGNKAKAVKAFEAVVAANYLKAADQLNLMEAIGQLHFQLSNYPLAISWTERYLAGGGTDAKAKVILTEAHYLNKDFMLAYKGVSETIQADIAAGKMPSEQNLKLLYSCASQLNDKALTLNAVVQLNTYYPTSKNWLYLIGQIHLNPGFSERQYINIYRLKQELGLMSSDAEYIDMADLVTRAGLPAEAKKVLEQGFASGILGHGAEAKKHAALLDAANKRAADDLKTMQQGEAGAQKSKDGTGLVNLGMAYATSGQFDKGTSLIEQGITKGGLKNLEDAKLSLGVVYFWSGKKDQAIAQFQTVQGADGTGDLARYWIAQINHPMATGK